MNHASPGTSFTAMLLSAVMLGAIALMPVSPAMGQVVIDMPPPPPREAPVKPEQDDDEAADDHDDADVDAEEDAAESPAKRPVTAQRYVADDVGQLALGRYVGARSYARPHDPYWYRGFQPRGRGVGPWGLGHPCNWYGGFHAVAPTVGEFYGFRFVAPAVFVH